MIGTPEFNDSEGCPSALGNIVFLNDIKGNVASDYMLPSAGQIF